MHPVKEWYIAQVSKRVVAALKKNRIDAVYFATAKEAAEKIISEIPEGATIGIGGSVTVRELNLIDALKKRGHRIYQHWTEEMGHDSMGNKLPTWYKGLDIEARRQSLLTDVYLCSTNAVTLDGKIVNADGNGNRAAAMMFGPKKVIIVAGVNKIVDNVDAGIDRVRSIAAPMSAKKALTSTPCAVNGKCIDCDSPDRVCSVFTIIEKRPKMTDMLFVLIGEELGF